jgi:hypothetical protein
MANQKYEFYWLYQELEQLRDPPFKTIFRIVFKGYISILLVNLLFVAGLITFGIFLILLIGGAFTGIFLAFWNWITHIDILPTFSNLLIFYPP